MQVEFIRLYTVVHPDLFFDQTIFNLLFLLGHKKRVRRPVIFDLTLV